MHTPTAEQKADRRLTAIRLIIAALAWVCTGALLKVGAPMADLLALVAFMVTFVFLISALAGGPRRS